MLYLASLRDCNSGRYLHPHLSPKIGIENAHQALSACHNRIFLKLLTTPIAQYVIQLEEYIRYTRAEKTAVLSTWKSIEAYRATTPTGAIAIYRDLFCLNVEVALLILNGPDAGAAASNTRSNLQLI